MAGPMLSGKSAGSRLKPVTDSLESVGFVSKGDKKLLDHKAQEDYYSRIVERYMRFCAQHSKDLDAAFVSLPTSPCGDATKNPSAAASRSRCKAKQGKKADPPPSVELSTILLSLRKLREAILATASTTPVPFSQRVHMFSVRISIRAHHPPSYFPSLRYLLDKLHSPAHPLQESDLEEFYSYLILDYACRQSHMVAAFELRVRARSKHAIRSQTVDRVLAALMHGNWVVFWNIRKGVDSYMRAVMNWAADRVRRHALKAVGSAYLNADIKWIVEGCTGDGESWSWERLVEVERLGWLKEGNKVIIRRLRPRPEKKLNPTKESM